MVDIINYFVYYKCMEVGQDIKILCAKVGINLAQLAKKLNMSPQALSQKIKRGSFCLDDLKTIALVTDCKLECAFVFPNGDKINL